MTDFESTFHDMHMAAQTPEAFQPVPQEPIFRDIDWRNAVNVGSNLLIGSGLGIVTADLLTQALSVDWNTSPGIMTLVGLGVAGVGAEIKAACSKNVRTSKIGRALLATTIVVTSWAMAYRSYDPGPGPNDLGYDSQDGPEGSTEAGLWAVGGAVLAVGVSGAFDSSKQTPEPQTE